MATTQSTVSGESVVSVTQGVLCLLSCKHCHVETLGTLGNLSITDEAHFDNDYTEESSVTLMSEPSPMDMESQAAFF